MDRTYLLFGDDGLKVARFKLDDHYVKMKITGITPLNLSKETVKNWIDTLSDMYAEMPDENVEDAINRLQKLG